MSDSFSGQGAPQSDPPPQRLSEQALAAWGINLGSSLHPPAIVTLSGDLGAGKTHLVRAICEGYGVVDQVTSPTFALIHCYHSPRSPVFHIDLYRLAGERECAQLGLEEIFSSDALTLVEWPERAAGLLPPAVVRLLLEHDTSDSQMRLLTQLP